MKKVLNLLIVSVFGMFMLMVVLPSCEGPQGAQGTAGIDGTDGTDGVDANSWCIECHTMANKNTIKAQFAGTKHGPMNGSVGYAGGRNGCTKCHSYQGFMETQLTGRDTTAANIPIPAAFKCDMCHTFHGTLEQSEFPDYALRATDPISLIYNEHATSVDLSGSSNLCSNCHQPRNRDGFPLVPNGPDSVAVTSGHWGTHYGTQSVIMAGAEGFEWPGSMAYESSGHNGTVDCAGCHMNKDGGDDVGGHTWRMKNPEGVENLAACTSCHSGATSFDYNGVQTEIAALTDELHHLLEEHKLIDDTGHAIPYTKDEGLGRKWTSNECGAVFNYLLMHYEGSHGVHNYKYSKALLVNSIELAKTW
jgi:hypothetical protein